MRHYSIFRPFLAMELDSTHIPALFLTFITQQVLREHFHITWLELTGFLLMQWLKSFIFLEHLKTFTKKRKDSMTFSAFAHKFQTHRDLLHKSLHVYRIHESLFRLQSKVSLENESSINSISGFSTQQLNIFSQFYIIST